MPTWLRPLNFFTAILLISLEINPLLTPSVSFFASTLAQTTTDSNSDRLLEPVELLQLYGQSLFVPRLRQKKILKESAVG